MIDSVSSFRQPSQARDAAAGAPAVAVGHAATPEQRVAAFSLRATLDLDDLPPLAPQVTVHAPRSAAAAAELAVVPFLDAHTSR